ncbi:spermidine/putrescine-binding periplasmic protein [Citrus sinensis]|uniref:Spermidine/putrescine-binding periplasmic protein n=1 Tax=Citrus sinensis TaxID=2711 RepID=A0ACB8KGQ3_CITSI|nr:spermidine/putrescine-binding periplasmic protein [Citrus sinensis]
MNLCASIDGIFNNLSLPFNKVKAKSASYMAADLVSVGDPWLSFAIEKRLIEPIAGAPYRWGAMMIAYKKSKFRKHDLAPIEDWKDLWRPELAGRISMVNSPREVIGSVLKYMGASYNSNNIDSQVAGGKVAVQQNLALLQNQVDPGKFNKFLVWRSEIGLCNSRAFQAIPAALRLETKQIGGRLRGPSPINPSMNRILFANARALPFKQEVIPGASPSALEITLVKLPEELLKGKQSLDTNLIAGVPPAEILARFEFLEPLSEATLSDYEWLVANLQKPALLKYRKLNDHNFFIIVASIVEVSSFEDVYAYTFSLLKYRKLKN